MGGFSFFKELIEAKKNKASQSDQPWTVDYSAIFQDSFKAHSVVFPDLGDKLKKFIEIKLPNPIDPSNRYGKHDGPFTGPLVGFWHCHLRDDAILIYKLQNRSILLVCVVAHAEIEGKRAQKMAKKIAPYL